MQVDIIGDIHGCFREFAALTETLGYHWDEGVPIHPDGRKLGFVGDLTDRGPESLNMIEIVCALVERNLAYYVPSNHCNKLYRVFFKDETCKSPTGLRRPSPSTAPCLQANRR